MGFPKRDAGVDFGTGVWGIWMPGFCQFLTGTYLFLGLTLFGTFTASPPLYMAAVLGIIVFAKAKDYPVMGLFIGLACVYLSDILSSLGASAPGPSRLGTRLMGFFHLGVGIWLMYLMFATVLDLVFKYTLYL